MKSHTIKISLACLMLFLYINTGMFGLSSFFHFEHSTEIPMVNCPYKENGFSVCKSYLEHISNWQEFSNIILHVLFIFSILLFITSYISKKVLNQEKHFYRWKCYLDNKKLLIYPDKIIQWLALFENSPPFLYLRYS